MPNIIAHKLFAQDVLVRLQHPQLCRILQTHPQIYYIGSNGPDFLFFSHAKPWEALGSHKLNHLGSRVHAEGINDFYRCALPCIRRQIHTSIKERMLAYICGHLCHWALDKSAHPYIFYRTGNCKGQSSCYHHRFESMIDSLLLKQREHKTIREYPLWEICAIDDDILQAIARIYVPVAKNVYQVDVKVHELRKALRSWYDIQKLLYDPHDRKYQLLHHMEKLFGREWRFSGSIVRVQESTDLDVLNEQKHFWVHPCDDQQVSNASFMELYEAGIQLALQVLPQAYACIEQGEDSERLCELLKDQAYDTGMAGKPEKRYFSIIFEKR